jgi:predicted dehydrogenase/threonine dehydrogenase-like Zn-dependent dehydrogenase
MKQVFRRVIDRRGRVVLLDLPEPHVGNDQLLVHTRYSLISTGTEMSTLAKTPVELARQTLADPWMRNAVKQTVFSAGLQQTARRVWHEMITPREIGYSGAGTVLAVGRDVDGFKIGQTVAYAATGHAELAAPTINHVVAVPDTVDLRQAAFVTVGGIAIQALRRAELQFGEVVAIYGLGLVGQIAARIALAAGCVVVGIDVNPKANELALAAGASLAIDPREPDAKRRIADFTGKQGVDATIICASSDSAEIINSSMEITRRQGRVVIVGYVNLDIHPKEFLYREIDLRYSRAYGPGSYHTGYDKGRVDYPFGYVRWTEQRNLAELVRLLASGAVDLEPLIGGVFDLIDAQAAFDAVHDGTLPGVAALLRYDEDEPDRSRTRVISTRARKTGSVGVSLIGFGNHALAQHVPNLRAMSGVEIRGVASATARDASIAAKRIGATEVTTDFHEVLKEPGTDAVLICSSQPEHFEHLMAAIDAGKPTLVEKPMVTRLDDLGAVLRAMSDRDLVVATGLNRRYSPALQQLRDLVGPDVDYVHYAVTRAFLPPDHWSLDPIDGGGRLISEGEHFVDVCNVLLGEPRTVYARALGPEPDDLRTLCNYTLTIHYDRAVANIVFDESGAPDFPQEMLTVLAKGKVATLNDFGALTVHGREVKGDGIGHGAAMGHREQLKAFVAAVRGEPSSLMSWEDAALASLTVFAAQESIRRGEVVDVAALRAELLSGDRAGEVDTVEIVAPAGDQD